MFTIIFIVFIRPLEERSVSCYGNGYLFYLSDCAEISFGHVPGLTKKKFLYAFFFLYSSGVAVTYLAR